MRSPRGGAKPTDPGFVPNPPVSHGVLDKLLGEWKGTGVSLIELPIHDGQAEFLALGHETTESLTVEKVADAIPNRTFFAPKDPNKPDQMIGAMLYKQEVAATSSSIESQGKLNIHIENGMMLFAPAVDFADRSAPSMADTYIRLGSIPHGVAVRLSTDPKVQPTTTDGKFPTPQPSIFPIARAGQNLEGYAEGQLGFEGSLPKQFQNFGKAFDDRIAEAEKASGAILRTTTIRWGGACNVDKNGKQTCDPTGLFSVAQIPFLATNASVSKCEQVIWIMEAKNGDFYLAYLQEMLLEFANIGWPHVTMAVLKRQPPKPNNNNAAR